MSMGYSIGHKPTTLYVNTLNKNKNDTLFLFGSIFHEKDMICISWCLGMVTVICAVLSCNTMQQMPQFFRECAIGMLTA